MLAAPSLGTVLSHRERHPDALCCILLAPPFSKLAKEGVIPRIGYLNEQSARHVHFYCAGYGGYWHRDSVPDMQEIGELAYADGSVIPWSFSPKIFSSFVDELRDKADWHYGGETELIVLNANVDFLDCLVLDIDSMLKDGAIERSSALFEALIQHAKALPGRATPRSFSDSKAPGLFGQAILGVLTEGPKALGKTWKAGRHYATKNLVK